jgi:hypothetical protein
LKFLINDCINIENEIKTISKIINESFKKFNSEKNLEVKFSPGEQETNKFLEEIKNFGEICYIKKE